MPLLLLGGAGSENALPELAKPPASSVLVRIPDRLKCVGVEVEAMDMDMEKCSPTAVLRAHKSQFSSIHMLWLG
jgi:hypothetical protein